MRLLKCHVTPDLKASSIHKASVRSFGGLQIRIFKGHQILGFRIHGFCWATFFTLATWKSDSCRFVKSPTPGNWLHVNHCWTFCNIKMWLLMGHESLRSRISCFLCFTLRHFETVKMRFLKCPETLGWRLCEYWRAIFDILMTLCWVVRPWV